MRSLSEHASRLAVLLFLLASSPCFGRCLSEHGNRAGRPPRCDEWIPSELQNDGFASHCYESERSTGITQRKCSRRLLEKLADSRWSEALVVWIYFSDHGPARELVSGRNGGTWAVSQRAAFRMMRRMPGRPSALISVYRGYIEKLSPNLEKLRHVSVYFNAVSAEVLPSAIQSVCSLKFVSKVDVVVSGSAVPLPEYSERLPSVCRPHTLETHDLEYGESVYQIEQIQAAALLERGYNGSGSAAGSEGILVCVMDSGFRREHEALGHINVLAERDFVQGDSVTSNEQGDHPWQDRHGTLVLGTIAGYREGDLIGPAWGADYILAKTEIEGIEIRVEEDNWVAGIEWADSFGADIVTSSLGYFFWYPPDSLDGETPLCTRAADIAVSRGIVVVNSAGNRGTGGMVAPADGNGVIAVGAVDRNGEITDFSSRGPTADGRIKPDLVAMGKSVRTVEYPTTGDYGSYDGTSFAAPLVAGLCALLLEIHPDWSPVDVRDALLGTATRCGMPGNTYGHGVPQGLLAAGLVDPSFTFSGAYPNPFRNLIRLDLFFPAAELVTAKVYDCRGALLRTIYENRTFECGCSIVWDGTDDAGCRVAAGIYFLVFKSGTLKRNIKLVYLP